MCGIASIMRLNLDNQWQPDVERMIALLQHRGPEVSGIFRDAYVQLGHARLSIVDIEGGIQPLPNEDCTIWCVCNGEIFNHLELRAELVKSGHYFRTQSDSEVLLHLYEECGMEAFSKLNGQFAFIIWDKRQHKMVLVRDRVGIRPLFYTVANGHLLVASEIKALLATGIYRDMELRTLLQIFTTWSPLPHQTMFKNIFQLPAGCVAVVENDAKRIAINRYWQMKFNPGADDLQANKIAVRNVLENAVTLRLRADVPIGAYLSGGLDSTLITALAQQHAATPLHTFSISFADQDYDESDYQYLASEYLGTEHHVVNCDSIIIRDALPKVIYHTENPIMRLSPVPMYLLAQAVHETGLKVILTGEGADEFFGGYNIFREAMVRRFIARNPDMQERYLLFKKLYSYDPLWQSMPIELIALSMAKNIDSIDEPSFSHCNRWLSGVRHQRFFSNELRHRISDYNAIEHAMDVVLNDIKNLSPLAQAQHIEISTFMTTYLLSSQGDRVAMAHAVESRYPFLDHHVIEIANNLPENQKIRYLHSEKYILKKIAEGLIPPEILQRPKQPYRSPIRSVFSGNPLPDYAAYALSETKINDIGLFDTQRVQQLMRKIQTASRIGENDQMAFIGVLSTQLFYDLFILNQPVNHQITSKIIDVQQHYQN